MKVNDPDFSSLASTGASRTQETGRTGQTDRTPEAAAAGGAAPSDDIHLPELVRTLRALASDSPDRQTRIEQIARAYARGTYKADAQATASGIIEDALEQPRPGASRANSTA